MFTQSESIRFWGALMIFIAAVTFGTINVVWDIGSKFSLLCLVFGAWSSGRELRRLALTYHQRQTAQKAGQQ